MPEEARAIALSINQIEKSAKVIRNGQKTGAFRKGDAKLLATCFWASVQGIMEEMASNPDMKTPKGGMDCIDIKVDMLTNIFWSDRIENGFSN